MLKASIYPPEYVQKVDDFEHIVEMEGPHDLVGAIDLNQLEAEMLNVPQVECPVIHHFGPGIYIREVHIPAGTFAIGHAHKHDHLNIMLSGRFAMLGDDGTVRVLQAPLIVQGKPGRKMGYAIDDTVWQNIYATDERDVEKLEAMLLDKSPYFADLAHLERQRKTIEHEVDRLDFLAAIQSFGFTADLVRTMSEATDDYDEIPQEWMPKITLRKSPIEGKGVFSSFPIRAGEFIGPARINGFRTQLGRYTNHAKHPNARFELLANGDINLIALQDITGCVGGAHGDEITVDYRDAITLALTRMGADQ